MHTELVFVGFANAPKDARVDGGVAIDMHYILVLYLCAKNPWGNAKAPGRRTQCVSLFDLYG